MKVLMVASGPLQWASSRLRMYWPSKYMPNVEVGQGEDFSKAFPDDKTLDYDAYIFQKYVSVSQVQALAERGKRIFWDYCDPLHWWEPAKSRAIADCCEKIVCSNHGLADEFAKWYGEDKTIVIPDRLELSHYPLKRQHLHTSPVRFIWYGVAVNRMALFGTLANLERLIANGYKVELTIYDDRPEVNWNATKMFPVYYKPWDLDEENTVISNHDIALLPPYPGPWGKVKSNNKALTAWACGLPVTTGLCYDELVPLVEDYRRRETNIIPPSVELSAAEWKVILDVQ